MMTKHSGSSLAKFISYLRNSAPDDCERPEKSYPLYWLAPGRDLGVRRVRLGSLCSLAGAPVKCAHDSNIYHYPRTARFVKYIFSLLGLESRGQKEPAIRVAKIDGKYFVEQGHKLLQLANAFKLEYVSVKVVEYGYEILKRKMQVLKYPDLELVAIATGQKGTFSYQGVSAEQVDVLLKHHRIPLVDHSVAMTKACSGAPAVTLRRQGRTEGPAAAGNRPQLTLIKKG